MSKIQKNDNKMYECPICTKEFEKVGSYNLHYKACKEKDNKKKNNELYEEEKKILCSDCGNDELKKLNPKYANHRNAIKSGMTHICPVCKEVI